MPADIDFNPLAPRGARPKSYWFYGLDVNFNPLAPRGARQDIAPLVTACDIDFNPLAPRGARHFYGADQRQGWKISIH